jgi:hypothetical protein
VIFRTLRGLVGKTLSHIVKFFYCIYYSVCFYNKQRDRLCTYNVISRGVLAAIVDVEEQIASGIYLAMRMRRFVICGLSGCTVFATLSHKRQDFRKKKLLNTKYVFFLHNVCLKHLIVRKNERDMIINVYWSSYKVNVILDMFKKNIKFSTYFIKTDKYQI